MSKKTVYLGPHIKAALEGHENASERIDIIAARYLEVVKRDCPQLTEGEWCLICDAYRFHNHSAMDSAQTILIQVEDANEFEGAGEKWGVDVEDLCRRLRESRRAGMIAALEIAQRYRNCSTNDQDLPYAEILRSVGARIQE